jgi:hypothetical protein
MQELDLNSNQGLHGGTAKFDNLTEITIRGSISGVAPLGN